MIDHFFSALLVGSAGYFLAMLLVKEQGPFDVLGKIRDFFGIITNEYGQLDTLDSANAIKEQIALILMCPFCASVYTTFLVWLLTLGADTRWSLSLLSLIAALGVSRVMITRELNR